MRILFVAIFVAILSQYSCRTIPEIYPRNPLVDEILRVRLAYPGMITNSTCKAYQGALCSNLEVKTYDMNDAATRLELNRLNFKCEIGVERYRICKDRPGYCRWTMKCLHRPWYWLFSCDQYEELFIPASEHQRLYDADTECRAEKL